MLPPRSQRRVFTANRLENVCRLKLRPIIQLFDTGLASVTFIELDLLDFRYSNARWRRSTAANTFCHPMNLSLSLSLCNIDPHHCAKIGTMVQ